MKGRLFQSLASALVVTLVGIGWAFLILAETPRGQVEGTVRLTDAGNRPLSRCDVYLTPIDEEGNRDNRDNDPRERRHTVTDEQGVFRLRAVPAGRYALSASARWHQSERDIRIDVEEARTARGTIDLKRSEPDLSVGDHQATFATTEKPFLPVRGYFSGSSGRSRPSLRLRVFRTRLSDVLKRGDSASALDDLRYTYQGPTPRLPKALLAKGSPDAPRLVADVTRPVTGIDREGFFVNRVPIAAAVGKPGLYLVEFAHGKHSSASYVLVSDLALVVKNAPGSIHAFAAHIRKGTPIGGAVLRYFTGGRSVASTRTDRNGLGTLTRPTAPPRPAGGADAGGNVAPNLTVASYGDDEAVVRYGGGWWGEQTEPIYAVHTVTDRTIYRPGDRISYKGIVRRRNGANTYLVPASLPVSIEVRDANGGLLVKESKTTNDAGVYDGTIETSPEVATGSYTLVARIGEERHTADVSVASYRKPEFVVKVTAGKARYLRGEPVTMTMAASYYFGAPVAGAKVRYYVTRNPDWSVDYGGSDEEEAGEFRPGLFGSFPGDFHGDTVADGEVRLDENGQAVITVDSSKRANEPSSPERPDDEFLPQVETYTLTAWVEDSSQRSVEGQGQVRVAAGDLTLSVVPEGYVAMPGKPSQVFVTVRDADGKPVAGQTVELRTAYEVRDSEGERTRPTPLGAAQTATTGADGRALLTVTPTKSGEIVLTASVRDAGGRTVSTRGGLWAVGDRDTELDTDYGDLALLTDRRRYEPGDTARVLVNTSRTGQTVWLSVEGDRVYRSFALPITRRSTVIELPIDPEWGPNVTLVACYVRDKKFASSETPLRVALKAKEVAVTVRPVGGDRYQPGDNVTYEIRTLDADRGRPVAANVALSVVDESVFALRPDDPKALRRTFYPPRTNRVSTAFSFAVEYLGDVSKAEPEIRARKRFRDTAFWAPEVRTDAQGRARVTVNLPENLTTWRATANAVTADTAVGYGLSKVLSSRPFFVRLETPRFLTGGDRSRLMALVHNETGEKQEAQVRLVASGLVAAGDDRRKITIPAGGVGTVEWAVTVPPDAGPTPVRVTVRTVDGNGRSGFTDGIEQVLPIRPYGKTVLTTFAGTGSDGPVDQTVTLDPAAIPSQTRLTVRVTPSLSAALVGSLDYLIGFPYGCTEQTMSRFYPDLLIERLGLLTDPRRKADVPRMVRDGVARLARLQHTDTGGWGWWERDADDPFMTAYVILGLATARAQGYEVEPSLLSRGIEAAVKLAGTAPVKARPFLLYALAEAGYDDSGNGILHTPFRGGKRLDPARLDSVSLAYLVLLGRRLNADVRPFLTELERREVVQGRLIHWKGAREGDEDTDTSDRMATALAFRVLLAENPNDTRLPGILRWLMLSRTDSYFGNTRDTSWVLSALCDYLRVRPEERTVAFAPVQVLVNGRLQATLDARTTDERDPETVVDVPADVLRPGRNTVRFVRSTGGPTLFYSGALRQTLRVPDAADLPAVTDHGITVRRETLRVQPRKTNGDLWRLVTEPVADGRFRQGDRLRVRLTVTADREIRYLMLEDRFPAGAEVTERGTADEDVNYRESGSFFSYDQVDVRDDRIAFFIKRLPRGTQVLEYNLRAQTPGIYHVLPTEAQAMYDATAHGSSSGRRLEVRP
ncbi:MAG: alpha-2-macroglobulin family protein [Capsulimonadales bacterium]|nr:alpha-2-macroglobulin family protein [Capsulimonadales bacterium]